MERLTIQDLARHTTSTEMDHTARVVVSSATPNFRRPAAPRPASEAQVSFLRDLVSERRPDADPAFVESVIAQGSKRVSQAIENLKAMPKVTSTPTAPVRTNRYPGRCEHCGIRVEAEEGTLTRSDEGKWEVAHLDGECPDTDFPFPVGRYAVDNDEGVLRFYVASHEGLFVQASDELFPVPASSFASVVAAIAVDPEVASRRYGTELGRCGRCNRTLTDEESRAAGIGPVCASKGW